MSSKAYMLSPLGKKIVKHLEEMKKNLKNTTILQNYIKNF